MNLKTHYAKWKKDGIEKLNRATKLFLYQLSLMKVLQVVVIIILWILYH